MQLRHSRRKALFIICRYRPQNAIWMLTMSVIFDKLSFVRRLERDEKFSRSQAEALSEAFYEAVSDPLATKEDMNVLRLELKLWTGGLAVAIVAVLGSLMTVLKVFGH